MIEEAAFAPIDASGLEAQGVRAMTSATSQQDGVPPPDEVRAQVQRMTASDVFASSPQLAAFLLFVVEAVLRGHGERLKGYTIGVEVLRRDVKFDPQIDPIVRVEATRLRRAIERYYAGPGADDPIVIDLPRGALCAAHRAARRGGRGCGGCRPPKRSCSRPATACRPCGSRRSPSSARRTRRSIAAESLGAKIAEAFVLFDGVNVMAPAPDAPPRVRTTGSTAWWNIAATRASICASS